LKVKSNYKYLERIDTRFGDNDIFGHINNVIYYSLFDSVINRFLISNCQYDPFNSDVIAISPETRCKFRKSLRYPDKVEAGLSTFKIGNTSIIYDISLFKLGEDIACAEGYFVHVFVRRKNMSETVKIPLKIKEQLEKITVKL
jgi:acyl-CoA thioester hydrolase